MGFYDAFRRDAAGRGLLAKGSPLSILRDATVLRAQNVADYYATEVPDEMVYRKQLGRLVPPWPVLWLETAAPSSRRLLLPSRVLEWPPFGFTEAGALVRITEWPQDAPGVRWRLIFTQFYSIPIVEVPQGAEWLRYPYALGRVDLDPDGYSAGDVISYQDSQLVNLPDMLQEIIRWNRAILSDVLLLSLSFCNCRNVALPETHPAPRQPNKIERRKHITPPVEHRFHTILIEPLKAKYAKGAPSAPGGAPGTDTPAGATPPTPHALHIVRGAFHTYTPERPLFGRPGLYGQFWVPQHIRGTAESGTVHADYDLRLDEREPEPAPVPAKGQTDGE